jgi:hypothetical protein
LITDDYASKDAIVAAVQAIRKKAKEAAPVVGFDGEALAPVVLIYFSGHGIQVGSEQYLEQLDPFWHASAQERVVCDYSA